MHMDRCIDMCVGICMDMQIDMGRGMLIDCASTCIWTGVCMQPYMNVSAEGRVDSCLNIARTYILTCVCVRMDMSVCLVLDLCVGRCVRICANVCADMCADMCGDLCVCPCRGIPMHRRPLTLRKYNLNIT